MQHKDKKIVIYKSSDKMYCNENISEEFEINIKYDKNGKEHSVSIRDKSNYYGHDNKKDLGLIIYNDGYAKKRWANVQDKDAVFEIDNQKRGWLNDNRKTEEYKQCFEDIINIVNEYENIKSGYVLKDIEEYLKIKEQYDQNMVEVYTDGKERMRNEVEMWIKEQWAKINGGVDKKFQEQNALAPINKQGLIASQENALVSLQKKTWKDFIEQQYGPAPLQWYKDLKKDVIEDIKEAFNEQFGKEMKDFDMKDLEDQGVNQNVIGAEIAKKDDIEKKKDKMLWKCYVRTVKYFKVNMKKIIEDKIYLRLTKYLKIQDVDQIEDIQKQYDELKEKKLSKKQKEFFAAIQGVRKQCSQVCKNVMDIHYCKTPKNISDVKEPYKLSQKKTSANVDSIAIIPMENGKQLKDQAIILYSDGYAKLGLAKTEHKCSPTEMHGWLGCNDDYKDLYNDLKPFAKESTNKNVDKIEEIYENAMKIYFNSLSDKAFESLCQQKEQPYLFLNNMLRAYKKELKQKYLNDRTNEKLAERYRKIKIKLLRDKYKSLNIQKANDHYIVEKKDSKKPQDRKKFYFYSFQKTIENFNKKDYTGELGKVAKIDNEYEGKSISALCVDHRDNLMTSHFLQDKAPFAVGCNFLVANDILRNHDSIAYHSCGIFQEAHKDLFVLSRTMFDQTLYKTDHCAVARAANDVSTLGAILTNRYYKQSHKKKTHFDELLLQTKNNTYSTYDFCLYFDFSYEGGWELESHINETKETILSQIEKVVKANKKKGIKKIHIIDYDNAPSFVTIPNDLECIKEYVGHRKTGKNFGSEQIEDMNKKYEQAHKNELAKKKDENIPSSLKPIKKKNNNNKIIIDADKDVNKKQTTEQINKQVNNKQPEQNKKIIIDAGNSKDDKKEQTTKPKPETKLKPINKNNLELKTKHYDKDDISKNVNTKPKPETKLKPINKNNIKLKTKQDDKDDKYVNHKKITKLKLINQPNNFDLYTKNNKLILPVIKQINKKNNIEQSKTNNNACKYVNRKKTPKPKLKLKPKPLKITELKLKPEQKQINQLNNIKNYNNHILPVINPINKKKNDYIDYCKKHNGVQIISGLHNKQITHEIKNTTKKVGKGGYKIGNSNNL